MSWRESNRIYTFDDNYGGPTVIFTGTTVAPSQALYYAPNQWHTINLKPLGVTADALFAEISGFCAITHGTGSGIANLMASFRKPNSAMHESNHRLYVVEAQANGGERDVQSVKVPLVDGCFEFYWHADRPFGVPDVLPEQGGSYYTLNLWLSSWGRYQQEAAPEPVAIGTYAPGCIIRVFDGASNHGYFAINNTIPNTDAIPQSTQGAEVVSVVVQPTATTDIIDVEATASCLSATTQTHVTAAFFRNGEANAIATAQMYLDSGAKQNSMHARCSFAAGTLEPITVSLRMGATVAPLYVNGHYNSRTLGGKNAVRIRATLRAA